MKKYLPSFLLFVYPLLCLQVMNPQQTEERINVSECEKILFKVFYCRIVHVSLFWNSVYGVGNPRK